MHGYAGLVQNPLCGVNVFNTSMSGRFTVAVCNVFLFHITTQIIYLSEYQLHSHHESLRVVKRWINSKLAHNFCADKGHFSPTEQEPDY